MFSDDETRLPADDEPARGLLSARQRFGQYKVVRLLGRGGMGEVYEVKHTVLHKTYALKVIRPEVFSHSSAAARFRREAQVMSHLEHPHIVPVDEFGETDGHTWLRMPLLGQHVDADGKPLESLEARMRGREQIPEAEVRGYLEQILSALAYAHGKGAIHRDIKPSNLLFDAEGRLKIADFGLVHIAGEDWVQSQVQLTVARSMVDPEATRLGDQASGGGGTSTQALLGTFEFMAPEQKEGREADERSDLYAVGLMAFRMLTGETVPGFKGPSRINPDLSPDWDTWVERAMESAPEERFASASAMAAALPEVGEAKGEGRPRAKRGQPSSGGRAGAAKGGAAVKGPAPPAPVASKPGSKARLWIGLAVLLLFGGAFGYYFGVMAPERERQAELARIELEKSQARDAAERARLEAEAERLRNEQEKAAAAAAAEKERQAELARLEMEKSQARDAAERARLEVEAERLRNEREKAAVAAEAERLRLARARGGIVIRTEPSGALVTVGALVHERASPLTLKDVRLGEYPVSVKAAGYETWTGLVEVKEDRFADPGVVKLTRKMGSVRVTSLPRGASVWSDGRKLGVTPLSLSKIPEGTALSYELRLEDYHNANVSGKVRYKEELPLRATLEEVRTGSVRVTSLPRGASVWSDGRKLGVTPLSLSKIPEGRSVSYELRLEDYQNANVSGKVRYKEELSLRATLEEWTGPVAGADYSFDLGGGEQLEIVWLGALDGWVGKYEVTNGQYRRFKSSHSSGDDKGHSLNGKDQPVVEVSFNDAEAYAKWLNEKFASELPAGYRFGLPNKKQWMTYAQCGDGRKYPWGDSWPPKYGNYDDETQIDSYKIDGYRDGYVVSAPVASSGRNDWGLYGVGGNVWEWTTETSGSSRALRGASWYDNFRLNLRCELRNFSSPSNRLSNIGFRVLLFR